MKTTIENVTLLDCNVLETEQANDTSRYYASGKELTIDGTEHGLLVSSECLNGLSIMDIEDMEIDVETLAQAAKKIIPFCGIVSAQARREMLASAKEYLSERRYLIPN